MSLDPIRDAFGRLRVSEPVTLFDSMLQYNDQPLFWQTVGNGTAAHSATKAAVQMSVTAGQSLKRQTRQYFRYQPGKSQFINMTGTLGAAVPGVTKRIGYFDDANGIFFELAGNGAQRWVLRSSVSGSVVETEGTINKWNGGQIPGQDLTKSQIWAIDLQFLGVGEVRCGFVHAGDLTYVHYFDNANHVDLPYMQTATLPLRYEMVSTTGAASDMYQICSVVISEGGFSDEYGVPQTASNGTVPVSATTRRPVLTIQPSLTFGTAGQVNRAGIILQDVALYVTGNPAYYEVVYGGTVTGGSAVSVGSNSAVSFNVGGTAISGGEVIDAGYVPVAGAAAAARAIGAQSLASKLPLVLDAAGSVATTLSLVATGIGGAAGCHGVIGWRELY